MAEFMHPTGPCADCGKPIANSYWYYAGGSDGRKEGYYHSTCGDPFGVKRAVAAERERCARIVEGDPYENHYRKWPQISADGNRSEDSEITKHCRKLAAAIRASCG